MTLFESKLQKLLTGLASLVIQCPNYKVSCQHLSMETNDVSLIFRSKQ